MMMMMMMMMNRNSAGGYPERTRTVAVLLLNAAHDTVASARAHVQIKVTYSVLKQIFENSSKRVLKHLNPRLTLN
jgi:hypothetical protein